MKALSEYKILNDLYEEFEFIDFVEEFKMHYSTSSDAIRLEMLQLYITVWNNAETYEFIEEIIKAND